MIAIYSIDEHPSTWDSNASLIFQEVDAENNMYQLRKVDMSVFGNIISNGQLVAMDKLGAVINLLMKEREEILNSATGQDHMFDEFKERIYEQIDVLAGKFYNG